MGTFHAKLLLVDRQVALINSNNIQDRPNVEACVRLVSLSMQMNPLLEPLLTCRLSPLPPSFLCTRKETSSMPSMTMLSSVGETLSIRLFPVWVYQLKSIPVRKPSLVEMVIFLP